MTLRRGIGYGVILGVCGLSLHGSNDLEAGRQCHPIRRCGLRLSLHGSNDLEAGLDDVLRRVRILVSASTEAMTLRRMDALLAFPIIGIVSASTEAMTLRRRHGRLGHLSD